MTQSRTSLIYFRNRDSLAAWLTVLGTGFGITQDEFGISYYLRKVNVYVVVYRHITGWTRGIWKTIGPTLSFGILNLYGTPWPRTVVTLGNVISFTGNTMRDVYPLFGSFVSSQASVRSFTANTYKI